MNTFPLILCGSVHPRFILSTLVLASLAFTAGCGAGSTTSQPQAPQFSGNTQVTVILTSTANDQLSEFDLGFQSITLTSQSGKTTSILPALANGTALGAEFMHINGIAEPLVTASIPQGIYTSATVTLDGGETVCVAFGSIDGEDSVTEDFFSSLPTPDTVTVNFPSPMTVTGTSMALSFDLAVLQSATLGDCLSPDGFSGFSMTPTFDISSPALVSSPTNSSNGKVYGADGQITKVDPAANSVTLSLPDRDGVRPLTVTLNSKTDYQGISGFSALTAGTFVDMDGAVQSDGSLLATRIAAENASAGDVVRGPITGIYTSVPAMNLLAREQQGKDFPGYVGGFGDFNLGSATFSISGELSNLTSLPFVPSFNANNMVPGQEVYVSAATIPTSGYPLAATVTLMPQIINGTILGSTQAGSFSEYTVSLASYDLFPMLAVQPGQTTVENNPSQVAVYVDSNTQWLSSKPLAEGSNYRFYGLVFNDNGTLRMDCAQISDGVAFEPQSSAVRPAQNERTIVRQIRTPGKLPQTIIRSNPEL